MSLTTAIHTAVCLAYLKRFVKTGITGFFSDYLETSKLKAQQKLQVQPTIKVQDPKIRKCQCCKTGNLHYFVFDQRGPPASFLGSQNQFTK
jgi:hypothetical protein